MATDDDAAADDAGIRQDARSERGRPWDQVDGQFPPVRTGFDEILRGAGVRFVVDLGADWSVEMLDFQRADTRQIAIAQLKTMLAYPAFDEIIINTRSHCQLAATTADGLDGGGLAPLEHYRLKRVNDRHLGIDLAFAPLSLASNPRLVARASKADLVERITDWQENEKKFHTEAVENAEKLRE